MNLNWEKIKCEWRKMVDHLKITMKEDAKHPTRWPANFIDIGVEASRASPYITGRILMCSLLLNAGLLLWLIL